MLGEENRRNDSGFRTGQLISECIKDICFHQKILQKKKKKKCWCCDGEGTLNQ